jgi:hypothetical protein
MHVDCAEVTKIQFAKKDQASNTRVSRHKTYPLKNQYSRINSSCYQMTLATPAFSHFADIETFSRAHLGNDESNRILQWATWVKKVTAVKAGEGIDSS